MSKSMAWRGVPVAVLAILFLIGCNGGAPPEESRPVAAAAPDAKLPWPPPKDMNELFQVEFKTGRVGEMRPYAVTPIGDGRIRLVFGIVDGGCIARESLTVTSVEMGADNVTTVHLLYALDGQPCKALFKRELEATLRLPKPGAYRIRLWVNELYYGRGEVPAPVQEITI